MSQIAFRLDDGSHFVADERHIPDVPPFGNFSNDDEGERKLASWVAEKWNMLFQMKRGETERLKTCELFYAGFHYENAWDNRNNPVTNYCYSTVETVWPLLTTSRPRPEPVPRRFMDAGKVKRLADYATYKMDSSGFDRIYRLCIRDLLKFGWCCPMIGWDARGRSRPIYLSPFDYYPDQGAHESEIECFAIAGPVPVRRLRASYPDCAQYIKPDNIASPSYPAFVQPYLDSAGILGALHAPQIIGTMPSAVFEGNTATSTGEYGIDTGSFNVFGQTAFLIQLFVRDYTTMPVMYNGTKYTQHEAGVLQNPHSLTRPEPCCPSGWRMVPMLASGRILAKPLPVDEAVGLPVVIGRNYEQGGRFYAKGELDDVIPVQRDINRSDAMIARALELQANPPVLLTTDSGVDANRSSVEGGEIIRIKRNGSQMTYLQPASVAESHFVRRAARRQDIQIVSGTPDALQGQRPVGVEAAQAMRLLTESAGARARAKGAASQEWAAQLLEKMIHSDLKKSDEPIYFQSSDGSDMWINPQDFNPNDFDVRWAKESGDPQSEQDRIDLDKELLQMGVIDGQQLLDDLDYPGRAEILQRIAVRQMQAMAAQKAAGGNGNGGPPR